MKCLGLLEYSEGSGERFEVGGDDECFVGAGSEGIGGCAGKLGGRAKSLGGCSKALGRVA